MKILVPTDFSESARIAAHYSASLVKKTGGDLTLMHMISSSSSPRAQVVFREKYLVDMLVETSKQDILKLEDEIRAFDVSVFSDVVLGNSFTQTIADYAEQNGLDLIIMGTKGASGIKEVLLGSNAAAIVNTSELPVIVVPEQADFRGINNIVYATDLADLDFEIKHLIEFADRFASHLHILNIVSQDSQPVPDPDSLINKIMSFGYPHITFFAVRDQDLMAGIDYYVRQINADLLAMFTHDLNFFEKLFGKSVTRKMVFHTTVPLLTLKKR